jgi:two-component system response regulator SaeR
MTHTAPQPAKILLVDDSRDGRLVRRSLLEEQGHQVQTAHDGEEGLKLFHDAHYDLVVTDYRMPRMNGVELIGRIRQTNPNARIILIWGAVEPLGLNEENTGADAVIAKSANEASMLMRAVKRLLNGGAARKPPTAQGGRNAGARAARR